MKQLYHRSSNQRKNLSLRQTPPLSLEKQNNSHFSNLVSHRFNDDKRLSLKSNKTTIASIPLITSVSMTPVHQSPHPETFTIEQLYSKMDNYLLVTNVLIQEAQSAHTSSDSLIKQTKKLRQNLMVLLQLHRNQPRASTKKSLNQTKIIQKLKIMQQQNMKLHEIINKQDQTNVKLILEMNDSQSNGIQYFKQKLQESYNSYKGLEQRVESYQTQLKQMKNIKDLIEQQNQNKSRTIQCLQQKIKRNSLKPRDSNEIKEYLEFKELKQIKQLRQEQVNKVSMKRKKGLRNEGICIQSFKDKINKQKNIPPFKSNIGKSPYTSPFEDQYLKCRDRCEDDSLHIFISQS